MAGYATTKLSSRGQVDKSLSQKRSAMISDSTRATNSWSLAKEIL